MQRKPRMVETGGSELSSFTSYKSLIAALTGLKTVTVRLAAETKSVGQIYKGHVAERRASGYSEFVGALRNVQGKIGGTNGQRVDASISRAIGQIDAQGGADIKGRNLARIISSLETRLSAIVRHVNGAEGAALGRVVSGLGNAKSAATNPLRMGGGFKNMVGESKDIIKGAFDLSSTVAINDSLKELVSQFNRTTQSLRSAGLKTALDGIKRGMEGAANAANDTKGKLKALGDAKKSIERLISGATGADKGTLEILQMEMKRLTAELKKSTTQNPLHRLVTGGIAKLQSGIQGLGKTFSYMVPLKRALDVTTGVFTKINGTVNKFARMQMGITAERAGYGRQIRGAGIKFGDMMGALAAGRSAGMDDRTTVSHMVNLQTQLSQARWGEGNMIDAAGRWGISTFNRDGSVRSANEMMVEFSRKLKSLGSDMEKLQFLTHVGFSPDQMEYVANYEKEANRMEKVKANPHLQTVFDKANIMDESGEAARIDKYTKLEQKRRQILNQNAIDQGVGPAIKRSLNPENWFFSDWTARQKGVRNARAEISNDKMQKTLDAMLQEMKKNGGNKESAVKDAISSVGMKGEDLAGLVDALKQRAEEMGDKSLIRDFEAAFKNVTGMTIDTRSNVEQFCEKLNDTFESIYEWAEKTVKKLFSSLNWNDNAKQAASKSFWGNEAKTIGVWAAGEVGNLALSAKGDQLYTRGTQQGNFRQQMGGKFMRGAGRAVGWAGRLYALYDTYQNIKEAYKVGEETQAMSDEADRLEALLQEAEAKKKHANGGRSDKAAIFGEAGPEYAIPVKHTSRTADLLNRAAIESGFGNPGIGEGGTSEISSDSMPRYADGGRFPKDESKEEYWARRRKISQQLRANDPRFKDYSPTAAKPEIGNAILEGTKHGLEEALAESTSALASGRTMGLVNQGKIKDFLTTEEHRKKQEQIDEEHPYWAIARKGSAGLVREATAWKTGGWALKGIGHLYRGAKATITGANTTAEFARLAKTTQQVSQTATHATNTLKGAGTTLLAKKAASESVTHGTRLAGRAARETPATLNQLAQSVRMAHGAKEAIGVGGTAKEAIVKMFEWTKDAGRQMADKAKGLGAKIFGKAEKIAPSARQKIASQLSKEATARANIQAGGVSALKQKTVDMGKKLLTKGKDLVKKHGVDAAAATGILAHQGANANIAVKKEEQKSVWERLQKAREAIERKAKGVLTGLNSAWAKTVKEMDTKPFLNLVRGKIKSGASEDELKELFGYKGLHNFDMSDWKNKKFMNNEKEGNRYGEKLLGGMFLRQENIDASLKAGKGVDVQKELSQLTDKYALAWKESGKSFDDREQRVAIAARQAGGPGAENITTFEEVKHWFEHGDELGKKQSEILAQMLAELKKDNAWKDKSEGDQMAEAKRRRREKFIENMDAKDVYNVAKYDKDGNEIKDQKLIDENANRLFAEAGVKREFRQEFEPKQIEEFLKFRNAEENQGLSAADVTEEFSAKTGLKRNEVRRLAAKAIGLDNMKEEEKTEAMRDPVVRAMVKKQEKEQEKADYRKLGEERAKNITREEAAEAFGGKNAESMANTFIRFRDRIANGEELNKHEKERYDQYTEKIGKFASGKRSGRSVTRAERRGRAHITPRRSRYESDEAAAQFQKDFVEESNRIKQELSKEQPRSGRTLRGQALLDERAKNRKGPNRGRSSTSPSERSEESGISRSESSSLIMNWKKKSVKYTARRRPSSSYSSPRRRYKPERGADAATSMESARQGAQRAMASTAAKVAKAESAAATGNTARSGAAVVPQTGGAKGGGNQTVNINQNINITNTGIDMANADNIGRAVAGASKEIASSTADAASVLSVSSKTSMG